MPLAAVMTAPLRPVQVQQLPDPILEKGGIIIETLYSEVCGTDVHLLRGHLQGVPYPIIPGHFSVGRVVETGGQVNDVNIEAMIDAGVQMGLTRTQAQELTLHTIAGSVELMFQTDEHPAVLRNKVTSPGGVTAAGLYELEKGGLRTVISNAVLTALSRTQQLSNMFSK
ncbi:pyrroline-5-carboxylate reductase [Nostoc linckia NIES-25]|nr:pyrroline-5-carboxylate reductase [Nostoc linckia NIES-25]